MQASDARRAVVAAMSTASALDLEVDDAVVLNDSNRLVVRLLPCDVVARVAPIAYQDIGVYSQWSDYQARAETEVELVHRLAETDSPVALLDPRVEPRVYVRDGFVIAMWTYFEPMQSEPSPADYAHALERLHAAMRQIDATTTHFMDRVVDTERWVASRDVTPELTDADRELLAETLAKPGAVDRRSGCCRTAAARRAAPVERAQHQARAALHRLRELLPRAGGVRPRVGAGSGQRTLSERRPRTARRVPGPHARDNRRALLASG